VPVVQEPVVQEVHPANPAEADAGKVVEHAVQPPETEVPAYVTTPEKPLAQVQLPGLPVVPTTPAAVHAIAEQEPV